MVTQNTGSYQYNTINDCIYITHVELEETFGYMHSPKSVSAHELNS